MTTPPTITKLDLAHFAARELGLRLGRARGAIRAGRFSADQATDGVVVWRAMALLCGTDLDDVDPQLAEALADLRVVQIFPGARPGTRSDAEARVILASSICAPARWSRWLEKATREAEATADASQMPADITHAHMLRALGHRLDCLTPYIPRAPLPHEAAQFTPENAA